MSHIFRDTENSVSCYILLSDLTDLPKINLIMPFSPLNLSVPCIRIKFSLPNTPLGFPGGSDSKESACNAGDPCSIPGSGRPHGEGNPLQKQPTPVLLPGKSLTPWEIPRTEEPGRLLFMALPRVGRD